MSYWNIYQSEGSYRYFLAGFYLKVNKYMFSHWLSVPFERLKLLEHSIHYILSYSLFCLCFQMTSTLLSGPFSENPWLKSYVEPKTIVFLSPYGPKIPQRHVPPDFAPHRRSQQCFFIECGSQGETTNSLRLPWNG